MMTHNNMYNENHKAAKFIIYVLIMFLAAPGLKEMLAITIWFWALNPIAYAIESLRKHPHQHRRL